MGFRIYGASLGVSKIGTMDPWYEKGSIGVYRGIQGNIS